ncbi:MAG: DUF1648 domain-containing protein [Fibrella sp.]|nr:DUF1648 domain-containing protein [Armatimonadota bacterium]
MKRSSMAFWVFLVGIIVSVGQILMLGPLLPERVASHFGANGVADGFMSREMFLLFQWAITGFIAALFIGLPLLIHITPEDAINLPNKRYWLAPERRDSTFSYLADRFFAFGAATLALLVSVLQLVYEANMRGALTIGGLTWIYLAIYLLYTVIWTVTLQRRFTLPAA